MESQCAQLHQPLLSSIHPRFLSVWQSWDIRIEPAWISTTILNQSQRLNQHDWPPHDSLNIRNHSHCQPLYLPSRSQLSPSTSRTITVPQLLHCDGNALLSWQRLAFDCGACALPKRLAMEDPTHVEFTMNSMGRCEPTRIIFPEGHQGPSRAIK